MTKEKKDLRGECEMCDKKTKKRKVFNGVCMNEIYLCNNCYKLCYGGP